MSETLPSQQNESQPWKRELPLHREVAGTLKPEETLALMGSFTESSLEAHEQANKDGELSGYELGMKQRTHAAALEQLSTLELGVDETVNDVILTRQKELEMTLSDIESDSRRHAEQVKLREQLAGIKLLDSIYLNVVDNVDSLAKANGDGNKRNPRNRAIAINEMIEQHNEQVSHGSESIADSPEIREAQERINARFAEQAQHPQQTETVDDARQKVAEVFGDTGEKERQALIDEVVQAAKGATLIYTDIPKELMTKSPSGELYHPIDGFNGFGDGLEPESNRRHQRLMNRDSVEAVTMMKTDKGVRVSYQFDTNNPQYSLDAYDGKVPFYKTEGGRAGNMLYVEAILPTELASKLEQEILRNPVVGREFAGTLANNNGVNEEIWIKAVRPPYDELPANWQIAITKS